MKKILTSMALISLCGAALQADELKFVTVLSQPIGAFAQVESLNEERPSKTLFVAGYGKDERASSYRGYGACRQCY